MKRPYLIFAWACIVAGGVLATVLGWTWITEVLNVTGLSVLLLGLRTRKPGS